MTLITGVDFKTVNIGFIHKPMDLYLPPSTPNTEEEITIITKLLKALYMVKDTSIEKVLLPKRETNVFNTEKTLGSNISEPKR